MSTKRHARIRVLGHGLSSNGVWWYEVLAANGTLVLASKCYTTKANALRAADAMVQIAHDLSAAVTVRGEHPVRVSD